MSYINPVPDFDDKLDSTIEEKSVSETNDYTPMKEVYFAFIDVLGLKIHSMK